MLEDFFNLILTVGSTSFFDNFLLFFEETVTSNLLPEGGFFPPPLQEQPAVLTDDLILPQPVLCAVTAEEVNPPALFFWTTGPTELVELATSLPHSERDKRLDVLLSVRTRGKRWAALQALLSASKALRRSTKNAVNKSTYFAEKASLSVRQMLFHKLKPAFTKKTPELATACRTAQTV